MTLDKREGVKALIFGEGPDRPKDAGKAAPKAIESSKKAVLAADERRATSKERPVLLNRPKALGDRECAAVKPPKPLKRDEAGDQAPSDAASEIDNIMVSMRADLGNASAQTHAFGTLLNLCMKSRGNQCRIVSLGGIEAVVKAMLTHPADATVQKQGCLALDSFVACDFGNQARVAAAGGITAIITAIHTHMKTPAVQEWACAALASLVAGNGTNLIAALKAGGRDAVSAAVEAHPQEGKLQHWGRVVLDQFNR